MSTQLHADLDLPISHVFKAMCKSVGSSISNKAWVHYSSSEHILLTKMNVDPLLYHDATTFKNDLLITSFLSKFKGLKTGLDLRAEALQKFKNSEIQCSQANKRLSSNENLDQCLLFEASQIISKILGCFSIDKVTDRCGWGPGATFDLKRKSALIDQKVSELPITCTPHALPFFKEVLRNDLHWSALVLGIKPEELSSKEFCWLDSKIFKLVDGCKITTVPKNAKTDRVIAIEPRANGFLQKGVGSFIRNRLKNVASIDLDDQSRNQVAAKRAYDYALATIDLSMASDTVAIETVYSLLPADWAIYLDLIRSKAYYLDDLSKPIRLEKFSSMGNGFTFELETLLFYGLTKAVESRTSRRGESVLVYGDDIICPQESAPKLVDLLTSVGFTINVEKSFIKGPYYESCGKHFFKGVEVTPIYQKEEINDASEHIRLGNRIIRCALRYDVNGTGLYDQLRTAWQACRRTYRGPDVYIPLGNEGDDGWALNSCYYPERRQIDLNYGYKCRVIRSRTVTIPANEPALLAWTLRRGVVTQIPFNGDLERPLISLIESNAFTLGHRWCQPSGEFVRAWT